MTKYSNKTVTATVRIVEDSDNEVQIIEALLCLIKGFNQNTCKQHSY